VEAYKARDRQGRRPTPPTMLSEEPTNAMEDGSPSEADSIIVEKTQSQNRESRELEQSAPAGMQEHDEETPETTTTTETPTTAEQTQQRMQQQSTVESPMTGCISSKHYDIYYKNADCLTKVITADFNS